MTKQFIADNKVRLSSQRAIYKSESFILSTRRILDIDAFVSRVGEGIFAAEIFPAGGFTVRTSDGRYSLSGCAGYGRLNSSDLVFYKFESRDEERGGTDRKLKEYMLSFPVTLTISDGQQADCDILRLYLVTGSDGAVNFPYLTSEQQKIVTTENANMLVQGVAGSGKTNVCIEKIIYCACRNYRGKVLYTTFSRGLLNETKNRIELFKKNIDEFIYSFEKGDVLFLDGDHKRAIEKKLGILFPVDSDTEIIYAIKRVSQFLSENVEYKLIEDIYSKYFPVKKVAGENVFIGEYLGGNRVFFGAQALSNISPEIIYKEIYGMIFGRYDEGESGMTRESYIAERADSFTRRECEAIYSVATDFKEYLKKCGYTDNNFMSLELIEKISEPVYSVVIADEVQDFTQVNLYLLKKLSLKLFCVGDALQMINPSYFNFSYLKRLMYGDITGVSELKHNFRSTDKIEKIAQKLGEMNISRFGTHSFVLKGESVPSDYDGAAVYVDDKSFLYSLGEKRFENITVIVGSQKKKQALKERLGKIEILTVAEAKGLERGTVVLADVLSDNADKWRALHDMTLNRKTADENSVYRYYFNLFYVGISRAKQNLFVVESNCPKFFDGFFSGQFERRKKESALALLREIAGEIEIDDEEFVSRIEKFCSLEQYENARLTADRLSDETLRQKQLAYIEIHEKYLRFSNYRQAGVEYWKKGFDEEARIMFEKSGDTDLFPLMDACKKGGSALNPEIVKFITLVDGNEVAEQIIYDTLSGDCKNISDGLKAANYVLRRRK